MAGDIWSVGRGHLVSWQGTSGQLVRDIWSVGKGHLVSWEGTSGQLVRDIWSVAETDNAYDTTAETRCRRALHKEYSKKQIVCTRGKTHICEDEAHLLSHDGDCQKACPWQTKDS